MKQPPDATALADLMKNVAVVFENMIALAQEGEAYLSELRTMTMPASPVTNLLIGQPTLLLVDDDGPLLRSMARALRNDFALATASTVEQALTLIESQPFDVVISDFHLPDGAGVRVLSSFAYANQSGVRILYTGAALDAEIIKSNVAGGLIHRLVEKPVTAEALRQTVLEELAKKRDNQP